MLIGSEFFLGTAANQMVRKATIGVIASALVVAITFTILIASNGFPYKYMDLDDSGFISPREAFLTLDMGIRETDVGRDTCVEIFALKDGQSTKQICSEGQ